MATAHFDLEEKLFKKKTRTNKTKKKKTRKSTLTLVYIYISETLSEFMCVRNGE